MDRICSGGVGLRAGHRALLLHRPAISVIYLSRDHNSFSFIISEVVSSSLTQGYYCLQPVLLSHTCRPDPCTSASTEWLNEIIRMSETIISTGAVCDTFSQVLQVWSSAGILHSKAHSAHIASDARNSRSCHCRHNTIRVIGYVLYEPTSRQQKLKIPSKAVT